MRNTICYKHRYIKKHKHKYTYTDHPKGRKKNEKTLTSKSFRIIVRE